MKHLLTLLLFISTSVMAESYLCISDAAGGATYDEKTKTYKSTVFRTGLKYILKNEFDYWTFTEFGKELNLIYECNKKDKYSLICNMISGQFRFSFDKLRYSRTSTLGNYLSGYVDVVDDVFIEIGACSKI